MPNYREILNYKIKFFLQLHLVERHFPFQLHLLNPWLSATDYYLTLSRRGTITSRTSSEMKVFSQTTNWFLEFFWTSRPTWMPISYISLNAFHLTAEWSLEWSWSQFYPNWQMEHKTFTVSPILLFGNFDSDISLISSAWRCNVLWDFSLFSLLLPILKKFFSIPLDIFWLA